MQFSLTDTQATITSFTGRTEKHGPDTKPAISLGLNIKTANTILDVLSPSLRDALYKAAEGQEQLPGVEASTPLLRSKDIGSLSIDKCFEGWSVVIEHGVESDIELGTCKVDNFRVTPHEGGSVDVSFRVGTSALDAEAAGLLWAKNGQGVVISVTPPEPKAEAIDGSAAAFAKDHPGAEAQGDLLDGEAPAMDATDHFIAGATTH